MSVKSDRRWHRHGNTRTLVQYWNGWPNHREQRRAKSKDAATAQPGWEGESPMSFDDLLTEELPDAYILERG